MIKNIQLFFLAMITVAFGSCISSKKTTTAVMSTWTKPGVAARSFKSIFVSALTNDAAAKRAVEDGIQNELDDRVKIVKSVDAFPADFGARNKDNPDVLLEKIKTTDADGILTVALLDRRTEGHYTPGNVTYNPIELYRYADRYTYYTKARSSVIYEPGYYRENEVYYLETNLYDTKTGELIWSAQSATYNPTNLNTFLKGYLKAIEKTLVRDGLLRQR